MTGAKALTWVGIAMMGFAMLRALTGPVAPPDFFIAVAGMIMTFMFGSEA